MSDFLLVCSLIGRKTATVKCDHKPALLMFFGNVIHPLSVYLRLIYLSVCLYLPTYLSPCLSVSLSIYLSIHILFIRLAVLCICVSTLSIPFICLAISPSLCLSIRIYLLVSVCLFMYLSSYLCIHVLSDHLSICVSTCLSVYLSKYVCIYLPTCVPALPPVHTCLSTSHTTRYNKQLGVIRLLNCSIGDGFCT